jgi:hypothetical protein
MLKNEVGKPVEQLVEIGDRTEIKWSTTFGSYPNSSNPNIPSEDKRKNAQKILRDYLDRVSTYREDMFSTSRDKRPVTNPENLSYEARCLRLNTEEISAIALVRDYCDGIVPVAPECFRGERISSQTYIAQVESRIAQLDKEFR